MILLEGKQREAETEMQMSFEALGPPLSPDLPLLVTDSPPLNGKLYLQKVSNIPPLTLSHVTAQLQVFMNFCRDYYTKL